MSDTFLEEREKPTNDKCMYTKTSVWTPKHQNTVSQWQENTGSGFTTVDYTLRVIQPHYKLYHIRSNYSATLI